MEISVIIPTYNRKDLLERCLRSIGKSCFEDYEVIIVDDCSKDETSELVKKYTYKYIRLEKNMGAGHARNRGAKEAKGNILVFIDSDVIIKKDTLLNITQNFREYPEANIVCGYKLPEDLHDGFSNSLVMLRKTYDAFRWQKTKKEVATNSFIESALFAIKKPVFEEFGGFTEHFSLSGGEDHEFGHRIGSKSKILFFKNLGVYHHFESVPSYFKKLPRRSYYWGTLFYQRKKFEERGIATRSEAINSLLALGSLSAGIGLLGSGFLGYVALVMLMILFVRRAGFYLSVHKRRGFFYTLVSIPFDYACYLVNALSGMTALSNMTMQSVKNAVVEGYYLINAFASRTPPNIGLFVTSKCNLLCKHCFYWKQITAAKKKKELTLDEIKKVSKNLDTLYYLTITGGEPSLREDLPEICETFYKNNNLRMISLHTNGMLPARVRDQTERILQMCKDVKMNVGVGIDGLEKVHNFLRGNKKSFKNALKTIELLKSLQRRYKNLDIQCCPTFSFYSKKGLLRAADYFQNRIGIGFGQTFIRGNPYDPLAKNVSLKDLEAYYKKRIRVKDTRKMFKTSCFTIVRQIIGHFVPLVVAGTLSEKKQIIPCKAGMKTIVIIETGEVFPCEMLNKKLGDLRKEDYDIKKVLSKDASQMIIQGIKDKRCYCTHEGNIYVNLVFDYRNYLKYLYQALKVMRSSRWEQRTL